VRRSADGVESRRVKKKKWKKSSLYLTSPLLMGKKRQNAKAVLRGFRLAYSPSRVSIPISVFFSSEKK
jgi:hypothetical protein